jgi:hypothetical protein
MDANHTPTQRRMLAVLADGLPHRREEQAACLHDDLAPTGAIRFHLANLRKSLQPQGLDILCVFHRRTLCYRLAGVVSLLGTGG